jgi:hypothetical protein
MSSITFHLIQDIYLYLVILLCSKIVLNFQLKIFLACNMQEIQDSTLGHVYDTVILSQLILPARQTAHDQHYGFTVLSSNIFYIDFFFI